MESYQSLFAKLFSENCCVMKYDIIFEWLNLFQQMTPQTHHDVVPSQVSILILTCETPIPAQSHSKKYQ